MSRTRFNVVTNCDEYRSRKGEVFAQYRLRFEDIAPRVDGGIKHLTTPGDPELARRIANTPVGMASWIEGGPPGATCDRCEFFRAGGHKLGSCTKYLALRKAHEQKPKPISFRAATAACRYFVAK